MASQNCPPIFRSLNLFLPSSSYFNRLLEHSWPSASLFLSFSVWHRLAVLNFGICPLDGSRKYTLGILLKLLASIVSTRFYCNYVGWLSPMYIVLCQLPRPVTVRKEIGKVRYNPVNPDGAYRKIDQKRIWHPSDNGWANGGQMEMTQPFTCLSPIHR